MWQDYTTILPHLYSPNHSLIAERRTNTYDADLVRNDSCLSITRIRGWLMIALNVADKAWDVTKKYFICLFIKEASATCTE